MVAQIGTDAVHPLTNSFTATFFCIVKPKLWCKYVSKKQIMKPFLVLETLETRYGVKLACENRIP